MPGNCRVKWVTPIMHISPQSWNNITSLMTFSPWIYLLDCTPKNSLLYSKLGLMLKYFGVSLTLSTPGLVLNLAEWTFLDLGIYPGLLSSPRLPWGRRRPKMAGRAACPHRPGWSPTPASKSDWPCDQHATWPRRGLLSLFPMDSPLAAPVPVLLTM